MGRRHPVASAAKGMPKHLPCVLRFCCGSGPGRGAKGCERSVCPPSVRQGAPGCAQAPEEAVPGGLRTESLSSWESAMT